MDVRDRKPHRRSRSPGFTRGKRSRSPMRSVQAFKLPKYNESSPSPFEDDRIGKPIHQHSFTSPANPTKRPDSPHRHSRGEDHPPHHHHHHHHNHTPQERRPMRLQDKFEFSLRIGNLNYQHDEKETHHALFQEFRKYGYIDIKVLGQSRDRHAYINFTREEDARRAKRELQDRIVFGRPIRIEWSRTTVMNKFGGSGSTTATTVTSSQTGTRNNFSESYSHPSTRTHSPGEFGDHALRRQSGHKQPSPAPLLETTQLKRGLSDPDPSATRTLFVGNLEMSVTERELREVFGRYGRIETIDIKVPSHAPTAYAFVKYMTITDAMNAKEDMQDRFWGRHRLRIGYGKGTASAKVWINNLEGIDDMIEVEKKCDQFGIVKRVDYREGDNHGYVHFIDQDAAIIAVQTLRNYRLKSGNLLKIEVMGTYPVMEDSPPTYQQDHERRHFGDRDDHFVGNHRDVVFDRYSPERDLRAHLNSARNAGVHRLSSRPRSPTPERQHSYVDRTRYQRSTPIGYSRKEGRKDYPSARQHSQSQRTSRTQDRHGKQDSRSGKLNDFNSRSSNGSRQKTSGNERSRENGDPTSRKRNESRKTNGSKVDKEKAEKKKEASDTVTNFADITEPTSPESDNLMKDFKQELPPLLGEGLVDLSKNFPVAWRGNLILKNNAFPTRMHLIGGDPHVAELLMRAKDDNPVLKITQRLRLEQSRLDEVNKRINSAGPTGHCFLLALPGSLPSTSSDGENPELAQYRPLKSLVSYLRSKEAAGIVSLGEPGGTVEVNVDQSENGVGSVGVLHAFPPCDFSQNLLSKVAPSLSSEPSKEDHIVAVVMKGTV